MTSPYRIPKGVTQVEETVRKSRFVTFLAHAPNSEAAKAFVQELRERHATATHHCWAFNAGPPGSTASIGLSDDGEPKGTAGRPMLHALLHSEVGEAVV
ncbi:MAG: IMPACT family protein, partial [Longimicrobiales bacterium]